MESTPQHYTVMARRFRPQTFAEVVGQEHVGQALRNAIAGGRVAHAYLFTGARGVGKTSTARIFAKALNCPNVVDGVPCNHCDVCQNIGAGTDVDVLEIDGASNRGIDDIRQLRANVNVRSMRSPNKVYIIDEVHMLTKEAFNALLKTLEEPPPNVKFVFCTTEPNKVPETILSRCQRFDFGTIATDSIMGRLRQIAEADGRTVDEDAIELVARRAAGSMRDSQSLFDQLLAFGSDHVTAADVHKLLGTAPDDRVHQLVGHLITRNHAAALELLDVSLNEGVQLGSFGDQLLAYFRDLLLCAVGASQVPLSAVTEGFRPQVAAQAQAWGLESISTSMQILAEAKARMQRVNYSRALLELALVRIGQLEQLSLLSTLIQGLDSGGGAAVPKASGGPPFQGSVNRLTPAPSPVQPVPRATPPSRPPGLLPVATPGIPPESQGKENTSGSVVASPMAERREEKNAPKLGLNPSLEGEFWKRLLSEVPEIMAGHLRNCASIAISGPNALELMFLKSYLFSKRYLERAEAVKRLSETITHLTGQVVNVRFKLDESSEPATVKEKVEQPSVVQRRKASVVEQDPFVQSALTIFGGEVVEVRLAEAVAPVETE